MVSLVHAAECAIRRLWRSLLVAVCRCSGLMPEPLELELPLNLEATAGPSAWPAQYIPEHLTLDKGGKATSCSPDLAGHITKLHQYSLLSNA